MVSPELLRRYPFFAGLSLEQIVMLAKAAEEMDVAEDFYFFREQEELDQFYLVLEGKVAVTIDLPAQDKQIITSTLGPGELFAWSALVPPHTATSNARALTPAQVVRFDCQMLRPSFQADPIFGFLMMQKMAQIIRERLRDIRIETLAFVAEPPLTAGS